MHIKEAVEIDLPPSEIWPHIEDPEKRKVWYRHFKGVSDASGDVRRKGSKFKAVFMLSGKETVCIGEILELDSPVRLVLLFLPEDDTARPFQTREEYTLTPTISGTRVEQQVKIEMKLNPFWKALIWMILRFGRRTEEPDLASLKRLLETGSKRS